MRRTTLTKLTAVALLVAAVAACGKKPAPLARPMPPPADTTAIPPTPPPPPQPVSEPVPVPPEPDTIAAGDLPRDLDALNRSGLLKPVFFELDSAELNPAGQQVLQENAAVLKKYGSMQVTIEGHCDERGTAEYNLALGERRAAAARAYLVSLGLPAARVRTVSYGKEFPFDPGHDEAAWSKNRRAHFVITAR
jgi:peptidoglycan-associated lipoprotein